MEVKNLKIGKTSEIILKRYRLTRILESWVEINTTVDKAWNALVDFESWTQWNSFIPVAKGELKVGNKMMIKVKSPGLKEMNFKPTVFEIEDGKKVVWGGGSLLIGYRGIHEFIIEYIDENLIRFKQIEKFEGPIVLFMNGMISKTAIGYVNMNEEFKKFLEKN
ncbi:SRPBCC domain-containing protein [Planococcus sp. ISL-109]|uniref:SRPBCC domain-containing protein n=1 Tax=Planococcus sp. ISL-109 TaxID=2819166 RepID=UPI001BE8CCED|nr:SRPBCC domain-containing protein [Planococcus sp. ISL-109]MBT2581626.1 SRPBCC domain-containing protein [Planococcus sp. ISL-109]